MVPLESSQILSQLPPAELDALKRAMSERAFTTGQTIFKEGDAGDGIYVVKSGAVEISVVVGSQGERKLFAREGPGAWFGELAMVDNQPRSASATAAAETTVYFIPRESLLEAMAHSPQFTTSLMQGITRRLREFNRQYVDEVLQTERLALVGRFTRSIVHDLKNPLNIIGIASDMAAGDRATPEMRIASRERIRKQINRISGLVNEVVEFTRNSHSTFILAPVDFHRFIAQTLDELRPELDLRSIELRFVNPPPEVRISANPERLARVFHNLLGNAGEAMRSGGTVSVEFLLEARQLRTTITDTGPGIPEEIADKLFTAFVTHGKPNGTGLGLSICQRIIEDHHGRITGGNAPGGGAQFSFTLPVVSVA